jgi:hypothetical protein
MVPAATTVPADIPPVTPAVANLLPDSKRIPDAETRRVSTPAPKTEREQPPGGQIAVSRGSSVPVEQPVPPARALIETPAPLVVSAATAVPPAPKREEPTAVLFDPVLKDVQITFSGPLKEKKEAAVRVALGGGRRGAVSLLVIEMGRPLEVRLTNRGEAWEGVVPSTLVRGKVLEFQVILTDLSSHQVARSEPRPFSVQPSSEGEFPIIP